MRLLFSLLAVLSACCVLHAAEDLLEVDMATTSIIGKGRAPRVHYDEGREFRVSIVKHLDQAAKIRSAVIEQLRTENLLRQVVIDSGGYDSRRPFTVVIGLRVPREVTRSVLTACSTLGVPFTVGSDDEDYSLQTISVGGEIDANLRITQAEIERLTDPALTQDAYEKLLPRTPPPPPYVSPTKRGLLARYTFSVDGREVSGHGEPMELLRTSIDQGALAVNGSYKRDHGSDATAPLPQLDYLDFTLAIAFKAVDFDDMGRWNHHDVIAIFGSSCRWFGLERDDDERLVLSFNNGDDTVVVPRTRLIPGRWHSVICGVDMRTHTVKLRMDGVDLPPVNLDPKLILEVVDSDFRDTDRELCLVNHSNGHAFHGVVDDIRVYNGQITREERDLIESDARFRKEPALPSEDEIEAKF